MMTTNKQNSSNRKSRKRPTYVGLKLALAGSSLVASLLGARLLEWTDKIAATTETPAQQQTAIQPMVVVVRRYVEVTPAGQTVTAGQGANAAPSASLSMSLPPIPTAVPFVAAPPPVTTTRSS